MLLSIKEVSKRLSCNPNFVYELINAGILPYLQMKSKRVREETLEEFTKKYEGWDISDPYHPVNLAEPTA